ncbi:MAG: phosphate acyltransferase PlsX [Candidatus Dormibacteraeota bacterium]|uniref:Phosphate acyltransferase n=1 Tax=Candidatus Aeolococcus gillhamiae TaxID=3127015 RepID=A0A2W6AU65_9BACT|nr:phosphate acyltransferase PlsX [Candidatus Dormibacteraeota bacterium]PZR81411.1 MAG: phosphate acyltransferase PlsX [Candidatus Dormibacter sp. RRmetagenome_bin12]
MADVAPVAVDAMGGDHAPAEIVRGALRAATELQIPVVLVGRRELLESELARIEGPETVSRARLSIVDAREVVEMDEHPANAVRSKRDSSVVRACALVAEGKAGAAVSAGNSGAVLAAALFTVKRIPGIARPAIGALLPSRAAQTFLLDVGANTDCKAEWLVQFALMGTVYARTMMAVPAPRVGLLSNGEEPGKGSQLVQEAYPLLEASALQFIGNVESKELFTGACDVAVCDGFVGNIALKTAEGVGEFLFAALRDAAMGSLSGKVGGQLLKPRLRALRDGIDYRHTGGALLLGVAGEVVIAHGRSDALAIMNAIRVAAEAARRDVSGTIAKQLPAAASQAGQPGEAAVSR